MHIFYPKRTGKLFSQAHLFQTLILLMMVIVLAACSTKSTKGSVQSPGQNQTFQIDIDDFKFQPNEITIPVGATVVWKEVGQNPHTVTADDYSFKSGTLRAGATFQYTFTKAGTFLYYCEFHGWKGRSGMAGAVTVVSSSSDSIPTAAVSAVHALLPAVFPQFK